MDDSDAILRAAETVIGILKGHRVDAVVIGAVALIELLARNPDVDLNEIRAVCKHYRLKGFEKLIAEAGGEGKYQG